jgi:hypothetical protein
MVSNMQTYFLQEMLSHMQRLLLSRAYHNEIKSILTIDLKKIKMLRFQVKI